MAPVRSWRWQVGGETLLVLSVAAPQAGAGALSAAEQAVVDAVLAGRSNAEIARERGTSPRTVANQLASAYRKLGIQSRSELPGRGQP